MICFPLLIFFNPSLFHHVALSHFHEEYIFCLTILSILFQQLLKTYLREGILLPLIKPAWGNLGDGGHGWWRSSTNLSRAECGRDFCSPSMPHELPPNSPPPAPPLPPPPTPPPWSRRIFSELWKTSFPSHPKHSFHSYTHTFISFSSNNQNALKYCVWPHPPLYSSYRL